MKKIIAGLQREKDGRRIPVIVFTKGGGQWLEPMITTGADALGLDWTTPLNTARTTVTGRVALQRNLDPALFYMVRRLQLKSCKGNVRRCLRKR